MFWGMADKGSMGVMVDIGTNIKLDYFFDGSCFRVTFYTILVLLGFHYCNGVKV